MTNNFIGASAGPATAGSPNMVVLAGWAMEGYAERTGEKASVLYVNPEDPIEDLAVFGVRIQASNFVFPGQVVAGAEVSDV